ncbi:MAG TPA: hypothetical protein PLV50_02065 [Smithella sp.]|nr:hypothetical protein [Smithella sp.]MDM7987793.1 hypothetical protein [Smithella sp.]HNY49658.1 hypothetical protein [Smithella sp.]HOG89295.1 hypothetical protein [Smithella sp.]HQG64845.1 hypothetical protein [Smithella sp.]
MNAIAYTKQLRLFATLSWVGSLIICFGLAWFGLLPLNELLPLLALTVGTVPIIVFMVMKKAICESCGGQMKISSGYPRIVYQCKKCHAQVDTGIYSDY